HRPTRGADEGLPVTQYTMDVLEDTGLLKVDFLGLSTLTIMRRAVDLIRERHGKTFTQNDIPLDDPDTYRLLSSGDVTGIFQVESAGMRRVLLRAARLAKPIYVTENGLPDADDDQRPRFLLTHLAEMHRAMTQGADVRGYYHWTLVDNFEWSEGWGLRFGLVALDPETQVSYEEIIVAGFAARETEGR
ncbi:MAG: family 1 glycosylhydrolase, partial [Desulfovibrio sp.]|nr:family 1 glycosylhydrolase [Desulfovibrio sp.]